MNLGTRFARAQARTGTVTTTQVAAPLVANQVAPVAQSAPVASGAQGAAATQVAQKAAPTPVLAAPVASPAKAAPRIVEKQIGRLGQAPSPAPCPLLPGTMACGIPDTLAFPSFIAQQFTAIVDEEQLLAVERNLSTDCPLSALAALPSGVPGDLGITLPPPDELTTPSYTAGELVVELCKGKYLLKFVPGNTAAATPYTSFAIDTSTTPVSVLLCANAPIIGVASAPLSTITIDDIQTQQDITNAHNALQQAGVTCYEVDNVLLVYDIINAPTNSTLTDCSGNQATVNFFLPGGATEIKERLWGNVKIRALYTLTGAYIALQVPPEDIYFAQSILAAPRDTLSGGVPCYQCPQLPPSIVAEPTCRNPVANCNFQYPCCQVKCSKKDCEVPSEKSCKPKKKKKPCNKAQKSASESESESESSASQSKKCAKKKKNKCKVGNEGVKLQKKKNDARDSASASDSEDNLETGRCSKCGKLGCSCRKRNGGNGGNGH